MKKLILTLFASTYCFYKEMSLRGVFLFLFFAVLEVLFLIFLKFIF